MSEAEEEETERGKMSGCIKVADWDYVNIGLFSQQCSCPTAEL